MELVAPRSSSSQDLPLPNPAIPLARPQSIAKFGLRSALPRRLSVIMGPGGPVCVTDMPEVTEKTRNVLLEGAAWNFINIRRTAYGHNLHSEA